MCGLVGLMDPEGSVDLSSAVSRMSGAVAHRGPDDEGRWLDPGARIGLGHRRMAVVDLSPAGHQPMISRDGRWVLAFNGEIYDHADHRRALESAGVRMRGHSDTEVLVELIARRGVAGAVAKVDGMFALAAWDRRDRALTLARDRLGEKPLYYGQVGRAFAVASELRALRLLPGAPSIPDPAAVAEYLRYGFVPCPMSILPGIRKLPPGCTVRVDHGGWAAEPLRYWDLDEVARVGLGAPLDLTDVELIDQAEVLLMGSVRRRLEADVPVGAFLSGGLDSSTVVALAQAVSSWPVRTFTVAVGGANDESAAAGAVARHLGTNHTTLPLEAAAALELAPRVARMYDEPFADPSAIPTALLCAAARQHVAVCVSGDGADELLAGYNRYQVARGGLARSLRLPAPLRSAASWSFLRQPPERWDRLANRVPGHPPAVGDKLHKFANALRSDGTLGAYNSLATVWDPAAVMLAPPNRTNTRESRGATLPKASPLDQMLLADQSRTLPDNMLVKVDRASMAVALEVRVPFLDHRFAEFTWRLPERAKMRGHRGKWLVRQVLGRHVPAGLWDRPKVGFDPPMADWLRGPLHDWSHDLLAPDRLRSQGLMRPEPVADALADHASGRRNLDYGLWTLLMLQSWLEAPPEVAGP